MLSRSATSRLDQKSLDTISVSLDVRYSVVYNRPPVGCHVRLALTNTGTEKIAAGDWGVYFCCLRAINSKVQPKGVGLRISHVNGCLHKLHVTSHFVGLAPRQTLNVYFNEASGSVARTDVMPNWYVAAEGLQARTLLSTAGESLSFVGNFDKPEKWKKNPSDMHNPFTPRDRFLMNDAVGFTDEALEDTTDLIVPRPLEVKGLNKIMHVDLHKGVWTIHSGESLDEEARFLAGRVSFISFNIVIS